MTAPIGDPRPAGTEGPAGDQRPAGEDGPAGDPRPAGAETLTDDGTDGELKGQSLDDALEAAGLSKSGTADEKRARLADHNA